MNHPLSDVLEKSIMLLKREDSCAIGAFNLSTAVTTSGREMSQEAFAFFEESLFRRIFSMVQASSIEERRGAVAAMEALLQVVSSNMEGKAIKYANTFKHMLSSNKDEVLLNEVAIALGHLAGLPSIIQNNDYVEFELNRGIEWLLADSHLPHRRLAGCFILRELATNTPSLFYAKCPDFFQNIWFVLKDQRQNVRDAAAGALAGALKVLSLKKTVLNMKYHFQCYDHVKTCFEKGNTDAIHGALKVVGAMITHCDDFMVPRFDAMCDAVIGVDENYHRNQLLRLTVIQTLPMLAAFCPDAFVRSYLRPTVTLLIYNAKPRTKALFRNAALFSLAKLTNAIGDHLAPSLPELLSLVRAELTTNERDSSLTETFQFLTALVATMPKQISPMLPSLLDVMMLTGLSEALINTLVIVTLTTPEHKSLVQTLLLDKVSTILSGAAYIPPGAILGPRTPPPSFQHHAPSSQCTFNVEKMPSFANDDDPDRLSLVLISLKTLATFQIDPDICLLPFVKTCLLHYLEHSKNEVRIEAVVAVCQLLGDANIGNHSHNLAAQDTSSASSYLLHDGLTKLLEVGLRDVDVELRRRLLFELRKRPKFDRWLRQPCHLQSLMLFLMDTDLVVKVDATALLGNQAFLNPGYVLPRLRLHLRRLIVDLQQQQDTNAKEEAAKLLCEFLRSSSLRVLVRPLTHTIVRALPLTQSNNNGGRLTTVALELLGELCIVDDLAAYLPELIPVILTAMQDKSSSTKREVSLRTLGRLVSSTGCVVEPYLRYPDLMPRMLSLIREGGNIPWSLKQEVLRTLGLLGALDPSKLDSIASASSSMKTTSANLDSSSTVAWRNASLDTGGGGVSFGSSGSMRAKGLASSSIDSAVMSPDLKEDSPAAGVMFEQSAMLAVPSTNQELERLSPSIPDYAPKVAIQALTNVLLDASLSSHYQMVTQAVIHVFQNLSHTSKPQALNDVLPHFLNAIKCSDASQREAILLQLSAIIRIVKTQMYRFLGDVFELVVEYWALHTEQVMLLVQEMVLNCRGFLPFVPRLMPLILGSLTLPKTAAELVDESNATIPAVISPLGNQGLPVDSVSKTLIVLRGLITLRSVLFDQFHLLAPMLLKLIDGSTSEYNAVIGIVELLSVKALVVFIDDSSFAHAHMGLAPPIIRSLVAILERKWVRRDLQKAVLAGLSVLARRLGPSFLPLSHSVVSILKEKNLDDGVFGETLELIESSKIDGCSFNWSPMNINCSNGLDVQRAPSFVETIDDVQSDPGDLKLPINQQNLQRAWDVTQRTTSEDWNEWIRRLAVELLRESPSPALRACASVAQALPSLAHELFHASFVSCWHELSGDEQAHQVRSLELAFQSKSIPASILQTLLNLAEFMEHDDEALPIDIRVLSDLAHKCHAHAKALHYKEHVFKASPAACVEDLISINKKLDQPEAAMGILKYAQSHMFLATPSREPSPVQRMARLSDDTNQSFDAHNVKESCLSKLGLWEDALIYYEKRLRSGEVDSVDTSAVLGSMKCLEALGQWQEVVDLSFQSWDALHDPSTDVKIQKKASAVATNAAWQLGQWDNMEKLIGGQDPEEQAVEGPFFRAVLAVHQGRLNDCTIEIERARHLLHNTLSALMAESYKRAYTSMIMVQRLSEIEEVLEFKKVEADPASLPTEVGILRKKLIEKWHRRLKGCRLDVGAWHQILRVRSLVLSQSEDVGSWIRFASLSRQVGNFALSERVLTHHLGFIDQDHQHDLCGAIDDPLCIRDRVKYAYLKHQWLVGQKGSALHGMGLLTAALMRPSQHQHAGATKPSQQGETRKLLVRALLKQGDWQLSSMAHGSILDTPTQQAVLDAYRQATELDNNSYKGWHRWAVVNFRIVEQLKSKMGQSSRSMSARANRQLIVAAVSAVQGFLRAVSLGRKRFAGSVQQDLLTLLNVWFWYGHHPEVATALDQGFATVSIDAWLGVLPQLIARIHTPNDKVRGMLHGLLSRLGRAHPQALVYPMSVALKSNNAARREAAEAMVLVLQEHSQSLVEETRNVSLELIRVAILWHEMWHEGIEEASRLYFGDGDVKGMMEILLSLHTSLQGGAVTLREANFEHAYGKELIDAKRYLNMYQEIVARASIPIPSRGGFHGTMPGQAPPTSVRRAINITSMNAQSEADAALNQAWDIYYSVFSRIGKQLPRLMNLELQQVSPYLLNARQLELAVPGTYRVDKTCVRIRMFGPQVSVINSKQRPRKMTIHGEDGHAYVFLLKGHEDLRQDERAMQLFGLVNALLSSDRRTNRNDLSIKRYAVTPLSHNAGVVGWVPNTDTLHVLIREDRASRNILLNIEHRLMNQMAPDYELLTTMQKLEVFESALERTAGEDLYRVLWLKSDDSEQWLDRRTAYTRSLAVMSMVGYILGLGDRHPSNLMLERNTGKILHIDFGDCFEVAMQREKFPEKVPFRLTRMLINAMEVSGIEGNYRTTCEHVMAVLRDNRDSLIAMLQAFVYDPLISWRVLSSNTKSKVAEPLSPPPPIEQPGVAPSQLEDNSGSQPDISQNNTAEQLSSSVNGVSAHKVSSLSASPLDETLEEQTNASSRTNSLKLDPRFQAIQDASLHSFSSRQSAEDPASLTLPSQRYRSMRRLMGPEDMDTSQQMLNEKALAVIKRVQDKLTGRDFPEEAQSQRDFSGSCGVSDQVDMLIAQASSNESYEQEESDQVVLPPNGDMAC